MSRFLRLSFCRCDKTMETIKTQSPTLLLVYQLLAHGRWFSPGTPASSTTKTSHHEIAESSIKHNKSINQSIIGSPYLVCGGRSWSTRREPPTMGKQLVNFITCDCKSSAPFFVIYNALFVKLHN
jgi:hypothetical protein